MILAMDLSMSGTAFAVLDLCEDGIKVVETVYVDTKPYASKNHGFRLNIIRKALRELLHKYEFRAVVREKGFSRFYKSTQALFKVQGVVDMVLYDEGFTDNIWEIAPNMVKKMVTGKGNAKKWEVAKYVRKHLIPNQRKMTFKTYDISDAIAVGITFLYLEAYKSEVSES